MVHLRRHYDNLADETRPEHRLSVNKQALALRRGLQRFESKLAKMAVGLHFPFDWHGSCGKLGELLDEMDGLKPRDLRDQLQIAVRSTIKSLVPVLLSSLHK